MREIRAILQAVQSNLVHSTAVQDVGKSNQSWRKILHLLLTVESSLPNMKSGHAVELTSVLNHPENTIYTGRAFDETFSKTMRKMWVRFAKTGTPSLTADISPDDKAHEWPLYDPENKQIMIFDEFDIHPEKESQGHILDWEKCYFLTKYFCM